MTDERQLVEKLRLIEALFARAGTKGEKAAAAYAAERVRKRIDEMAAAEPPVEYRFAVSDGWSHRLLLALLRRYDIVPYRYRSQRRTTVMARVSRSFVDQVLWPQFVELNRTLQTYLDDVTRRVIAEAVCADTREEEVRADEGERRLGSGG